jgi:hypothetical protein
MSLVASGTVDDFNVSISNRTGQFTTILDGVLAVPDSGADHDYLRYTLALESAGDCMILIDGRSVLPARKRVGTVSLAGGYHRISLWCSYGDRADFDIALKWKSNLFDLSDIPKASLWHQGERTDRENER